VHYLGLHVGQVVHWGKQKHGHAIDACSYSVSTGHPTIRTIRAVQRKIANYGRVAGGSSNVERRVAVFVTLV
jgi:hypothetical protein